MLTRSPKKLLLSWRRTLELRSLLAALLSWPSVVGTLHGRCCVLSQLKMCRGTPSTSFKWMRESRLRETRTEISRTCMRAWLSMRLCALTVSTRCRLNRPTCRMHAKNTRGLYAPSPVHRLCLTSFTWDSDPTATRLRSYRGRGLRDQRCRCCAHRTLPGKTTMTLTYPILNRSRRVLWLVTGSEKAGMLARLRAGDAQIPAGRVRADHALVLADR